MVWYGRQGMSHARIGRESVVMLNGLGYRSLQERGCVAGWRRAMATSLVSCSSR